MSKKSAEVLEDEVVEEEVKPRRKSRDFIFAARKVCVCGEKMMAEKEGEPWSCAKFYRGEETTSCQQDIPWENILDDKRLKEYEVKRRAEKIKKGLPTDDDDSYEAEQKARRIAREKRKKFIQQIRAGK